MNELVARPLLNIHFPQLAGFRQPLAGEFTALRSLLEKLHFPVGYGVEIGTLIDTWRMVGLEGLAEVDLGTRQIEPFKQKSEHERQIRDNPTVSGHESSDIPQPQLVHRRRATSPSE